MIQIYRVTHKGDNIPFGLGLVVLLPSLFKGKGESDQLILCVWVAHCAMALPSLPSLFSFLLLGTCSEGQQLFRPGALVYSVELKKKDLSHFIVVV